MKYRATHFVRGNVVVVGNGIGQEQLEAAINKSVAALPEGPAVALPASAYVGGDVKVRTDLDGASLFGLAFPVPTGDAGKSCVCSRVCVCAAAFLTSISFSPSFSRLI